MPGVCGEPRRLAGLEVDDVELLVNPRSYRARLESGRPILPRTSYRRAFRGQATVGAAALL